MFVLREHRSRREPSSDYSVRNSRRGNSTYTELLGVCRSQVVSKRCESSVTDQKIFLFEPDLGQQEFSNVLAVLESGWVALGDQVASFEKKFAEYTGARCAVALNSGTAALHLAYLLAGVRPGDEVIVPSLTFCATVNAVIYCGATPVFADIRGADDWTLDPDDVVNGRLPTTFSPNILNSRRSHS